MALKLEIFGFKTTGKEEAEMKKFMEPAIEVEVFAVEDVVTTSGCPSELSGDEF